MPTATTIPKHLPPRPGLDHRQLYGLGLQHVQRLSSRIWTDYNLHDPGITLLEILCYALTDLGYRASFPLEDLLASQPTETSPAGDSLFTARQILPNRPLTLLDYRKLLIDLEGIKNAWLTPAPTTYYADTSEGQLMASDSGAPGVIPVNVRGLYAVTLEYNDTITSQATKDETLLSAQQRLQANRNLCEDFVEFNEVGTQQFRLCAELDVTPTADVSTITAEIWFQVQQYLAPAVKNYSLSEMLARTQADGTPYTAAEIFEGTLLDCGFIDDEELAQADLRQEIRLSDVINILMDINGVKAVRDIVIASVPPVLEEYDLNLISIESVGDLPSEGQSWVVVAKIVDVYHARIFDSLGSLIIDREFVPDTTLTQELDAALGAQTINDSTKTDLIRKTARSLDYTHTILAQPLENQWVIPVNPGKKALLVAPVLPEGAPAPTYPRSRLVFYKQFIPVVAQAAEVITHYNRLVDQGKVKAETAVAYDFEIPQGRDRNITHYYSLQNHLPQVYGISPTGISASAGESRKALTYQLRAYLLFFDQLMANYCAQLSQVKALLSTDPELHRTYFYQVVESFADYQKIYRAPGDAENAPQASITALQQSNDGQEHDNRFDRRHRFLDHLIARFAERFNDFAYTLYSALGESSETLIRHKCDFLNAYPVISRDRALAYNYNLQDDADLWNSNNVSGLEKRLAKLLGIGNYQRRNLSDITYDIYAEIDEDASDEFRFRLRHRDTMEILLSSSKHYETEAMARAAMRHALDYASLPNHYERKLTTDGRHCFNVVDDTGTIVARRIEYFQTEAEMNQAIDQVIEYFKQNYSDEGMYLIENILLRPEPEEPDDPFLPICPLPDCTDCADADPYSYRIQIVLPAYGSRFSNPDFRRFAETIIRAETPAHILPKVCWINAEDMAQLEAVYRDWIYLKSGRTRSDSQAKLTAFISSLFQVKNVYPAQSLNPCDSPETQPKFILGRTALGTIDSPTSKEPNPPEIEFSEPTVPLPEATELPESDLPNPPDS